MKALRVLLAVFCLSIVMAVPGMAQATTGLIAGTVTDTSGAVIPNAKVTITNKDTGTAIAVGASASGIYSAPALAAGTYTVTAEAGGFNTRTRACTVEVGTTTTVDFLLKVGTAKEAVTVEEATVHVDTEEHSVAGVVTRTQIQDLPLNGRSFLQLASIEPGVTVSAGTTSQYNALFSVSVLGGDSGKTALSVDGGAIRDVIEGSGPAMNFSQEVVQEFQVSSVNFDVSNDITAVGAVNVVTRTGGNQFHGSGYFFYRDHNMAAYPGLVRNAADPNPFFARRNPGFWLGGPIKKDKLFFFFNYEHMNQVQAYTVQPDLPSLQPFAGNFASPYIGKQISSRFDYKYNEKNTFFARYSHDGNNGFGPGGGNQTASYWLNNVNWSDQTLFGWTSTLKPTMVNDFRFSYQFWSNRNLFPTSSQCTGLIGCGGPGLEFAGSSQGFIVGNTENATQGRDLRRFNFTDSLTWQKGKHRIHFGGEYEHDTGSGFWGYCDPGCDEVSSPEYLKSVLTGYLGTAGASLFLGTFYPNLPTTINSNTALNNLPFLGGIVGIGNPAQPPPYNQAQAEINDRMRVYVQDTWRFRPNLTISAGLAWEHETNLFNEDLTRPTYLNPLDGGSGAAATPSKHDFSPSVGFAWSPKGNDKWVVRGGAGMFWDTEYLYRRLQERSEIGPVGNGRVQFPTTGFTVPAGMTIYNVTNTLGYLAATGKFVPQVIPTGQPLPETFTSMTLGQFEQIYALEEPGIAASLANPINGVTPIDIAKSGAELLPGNYPIPRSYHMSLGFQHQLRHDTVLSVDLVRRVGIDLLYGGDIDLNHYAHYVQQGSNVVNAPVIPLCTAAQSGVPGQECSSGPITFWQPGARSTYTAMLVKADKRFANRFQFTASYALQSEYGVNGIYDTNNYTSSWGPQGSRNILNIVGVLDMGWGFQLGLISSLATRGPIAAVVGGYEENDSGAGAGAPLPGMAFNCLNRGCGMTQLDAAIQNWNSTLAGTETANFQSKFPVLPMPSSNAQLGAPIQSQDIRVTKTFTYKERYKLAIFGEVFNVLNIGNLGGFNFNLAPVTAANGSVYSNFGQPTQRVGQTFGSGGPRAIQVGARISF